MNFNEAMSAVLAGAKVKCDAEDFSVFGSGAFVHLNSYGGVVMVNGDGAAFAFELRQSYLVGTWSEI